MSVSYSFGSSRTVEPTGMVSARAMPSVLSSFLLLHPPRLCVHRIMYVHRLAHGHLSSNPHFSLLHAQSFFSQLYTPLQQFLKARSLKELTRLIPLLPFFLNLFQAFALWSKSRLPMTFLLLLCVSHLHSSFLLTYLSAAKDRIPFPEILSSAVFQGIKFSSSFTEAPSWSPFLVPLHLTDLQTMWHSMGLFSDLHSNYSFKWHLYFDGS